MEWADASFWRAVLKEPALARDMATRERLHHLHSTQWAYLQVLLGRPIDVPELATFPDLRTVGQWARRFYAEMPALYEGLEGTRAERHVEFPWARLIAERYGAPAGPATAGECILQLALHTAHHRGQVATIVRAAGAEPATIDYIAWIWMRRPAPDWSALDAG